MKRKIVIAMLISMTLATQAPAVAYASDGSNESNGGAATPETPTVTVSLTTGSNSSENNTSTEVKSADSYTDDSGHVNVGDGSTVEAGDVTITDGGTAVTVTGGSTVDANNIDASGVIVSGSGDETTYQGAMGANVSDNSSLSANNVTGAQTGVSATDNSKVAVTGNVTATGTDQTQYGYNEETGAFDIPVNTSSGEGIFTDGTSTIIVTGDVYGETTGILVNPETTTTEDTKGMIVVGGTVVSNGTGGGIQISNTSAEQGGPTYSSVDDFMAATPDITVFAIDSSIPVMVSATVTDATTAEITASVVNAINYIIKPAIDCTITTSDTTTTLGYNTVHINEAFSVAANLQSGYTLSGGQYVNVKDNGNGTFTLTLTDPRGGITIKAIAKVQPAPINQDNGENNDSPAQVVVESIEVPSYADPNAATPGSIVINTTDVAITGADGTVSALPTRNVSLNLGQITPAQFKNSVIENIALAPASGALVIETDRVACFDKNMIETLATRSDVEVNVVFTYNGKKLKVVIPAGYDVESLLDENGYCGFLRLMSILGAEEVI